MKKNRNFSNHRRKGMNSKEEKTKEEQRLVGVCPSCGKPLKIEQTGGEKDFLHCAEICSNPAAITIGTRLMADQAKLLFVDSNMHSILEKIISKSMALILSPFGEQ
jgi:hypothetical protein